METIRGCELQLWQLNEEGFIADGTEIEKCLATCNFIAKNVVWIKTHKTETALIANLLTKTKFTNEPLQRMAHINAINLQNILKIKKNNNLLSLLELPVKETYTLLNTLQTDERRKLHEIANHVKNIQTQLAMMQSEFPRIRYSDFALNEEIEKSCAFIEQHLTLELLPHLLSLSLEQKLPHLTWICLNGAMDLLKQSKRALDDLPNVTDRVQAIFEELKVCVNLPSPPLFLPNGWMVFEQLPECPLFHTLGTLFPISIQFEGKTEDHDQFAAIFEKFAFMQNLIGDFHKFTMKEDLPVLQKSHYLKSFGIMNEGWAELHFNSKKDIQEYIAQLAPLSVCGIDFGSAAGRLTDEDLTELSEQLQDLVHLVMRYSSQITTLPPAIQPEVLICSHSKKIEKLDLKRATKVVCDWNFGLKEIYAPKLIRGGFYECHQVKQFYFPKGEKIGVVHCRFDTLIAPHARQIRADGNISSRLAKLCQVPETVEWKFFLTNAG